MKCLYAIVCLAALFIGVLAQSSEEPSGPSSQLQNVMARLFDLIEEAAKTIQIVPKDFKNLQPYFKTINKSLETISKKVMNRLMESRDSIAALGKRINEGSGDDILRLYRMIINATLEALNRDSEGAEETFRRAGKILPPLINSISSDVKDELPKIIEPFQNARDEFAPMLQDMREALKAISHKLVMQIITRSNPSLRSIVSFMKLHAHEIQQLSVDLSTILGSIYGSRSQ